MESPDWSDVSSYEGEKEREGGKEEREREIILIKFLSANGHKPHPLQD